MQSGDPTYWLAWVLSVLVVGLGVTLTWWGLFGDRARGRRRCPRCWHDLSHTPGMTCSECGYTAKREPALFRGRRRLVPTVIGAVTASVAATWAIEQVQHEGFVSVLPTRMVLLSLPMVGGAHEGLTDELSSRVGRRKLTDGHYRTLIKRCLRGDHRARPVTGNAPEDIDLDRKLLALPARVQLGTDRPWPADAPVCLDLEVRHWWTPGTACRVHVTPKWDGAEPVIIVGSGARRRPPPYPLVIERPEDTETLDFDVVLERRLPDPDATWEHIQDLSINVPLAVEGPLAEVLQPVETDELHEAMISAFSPGAMKWTSGRSPLRIRFDRRYTYVPSLGDTAFGACVEILRDGVLARRLDLWWSFRPELGDDNYGWLVAYEDAPLLLEANEADGRWQMRVRGDPVVALRAGLATSYWGGEFTVPLVVEEVQTPAPAKDWWVADAVD
ncbi:MAG: hypothetical protein ACYSUR_14465 [Planctomycetota bacterium]